VQRDLLLTDPLIYIMKAFYIRADFKKIKLLWIVPFGYRNENVFVTSFSKIILSIKDSTLTEVRNGNLHILAEAKLKKTKKIFSKGFVGEVITSDGYKIKIADSSIGIKLFSISKKGGNLWSFEVNSSNLDCPVERSDLKIMLNASDHSNPLKASQVEIVCSDFHFQLSKVLGVLIYSYVFDFLLDRGWS